MVNILNLCCSVWYLVFNLESDTTHLLLQTIAVSTALCEQSLSYAYNTQYLITHGYDKTVQRMEWSLLKYKNGVSH